MPIPKKKEDAVQLSARERIYNEVCGWITDGTLKSKEKLNETELADYFSVSRTPVREALQLLADQHLVDMIPGRGSFVSEVSAEDGDAVYKALSLIHIAIYELFITNCNDTDVDVLEKLNEEFEKAVISQDRQRMIDTDRAFHMYMAETAGNIYLKEYAMQLHQHAYRYESMFARMENSPRAHSKIIDALKKDNTDALYAAIDENFHAGFVKDVKDMILSNDQ